MAILQGVWITPLYVNEPRNPGDRFGSIKSREFGYISVPADQLYLFQKGKRVCIDIEERGQYKNFKGMAGGVPPQSSNPVWDGRQIPPRPQRPPQRAQDDRRVPRQPQLEVPVDTTAMNIFITGVTGRALGSGHFNASDIDELVREAKAAYLKHFGGGNLQTPQHGAPTPPRAPVPPEFDEPLPNPEDYGQAPQEEDGIPY
jgi:hypothetical protein